MAQSRGKKFEARFRSDWAESVPDSLCYRLIDAMAGYMGVKNVCDFICYKHPEIYLLDCKSSDANTIGFAEIRQYEEMLKYKDIEGCNVGIVWWSIPNEAVIYVPVQTLEKIKSEGGKSFNYKKMVDDPNYPCIKIPSKKLRTFLQSDYSVLVNKGV